MLRIENLRKKYKSFEVLKGLNMNISKGEVYGFLGRNGCGKTTTMNIICNIIAKDEGKISFVNEKGENFKPKIGYLTESPALYPFMNGYEYLRYIAACANYEGDTEKRVNETLEITGMTAGARRRIKGYSRGMNQRLGIAAAIFDNPELLILDEPTSALDPEGRAEVMNIIADLKKSGVTIILCTHIITDVERVADRIGIMKEGLIVEESTVNDIMNKFRAQSSTISLKLTVPDVNVAAEMRMLPSVTGSRYNDVTGAATFDSDNLAALYEELLGFMNERKIMVDELVTQKNSLEDVYFTVTGQR